MKTSEDKQLKKFDKFVEFLKHLNFNITKGSLRVHFDGNGVTGDVFLPVIENDILVSQNYAGKLYFENTQLYDSPKRCPYQLPIPVGETEYVFVKKSFEFIGSPEGFKQSNEFNIKIVKQYP